jgi:hypothetical protein
MRMMRLQKRTARNGAYYIVIASEAKQSMAPQAEEWIASSLLLLAMTEKRPGSLPARCLFSSCPALCRASTSSFVATKVVDGRVKPGHDDVGRPQFSEARFGGEAGHDLISVS